MVVMLSLMLSTLESKQNNQVTWPKTRFQNPPPPTKKIEEAENNVTKTKLNWLTSDAQT